jgi:hypothetical protein
MPVMARFARTSERSVSPAATIDRFGDMVDEMVGTGGRG